jgi:Protein of unknown function (DUF2628)
MTLYTVLAPPERAADAQPDPLKLVFVKEGFCWPALVIPLAWLVFRRMWLILALYVAIAVGLTVLAQNIGGAIPTTIYVLLRLLFALEGNGLRRWTLEGAGYRLFDVVEGRRLWEAELRYFLDRPPLTAPPAAPVEIAAPAWQPSEPTEVVGLFPTAGG